MGYLVGAIEPFWIQIKNGFLKFSQNPFSVRTISKGSVFYPIVEPLKRFCKTPFFSEYYGTALYDRNTVHMRRVIYGAYTIVIIPFTSVYVNVNDCLGSFTVVVMIDLGQYFEQKWVQTLRNSFILLPKDSSQNSASIKP